MTTSIPDQIHEGTDRAEAAGIDILRVVTDKDRGASKYSSGRREHWEDEAIPELESGKYDCLVTWECARGTRDLEVLVILRRIARDHGADKWFYNGRMHDLNDPTDSFIVGMDVLSAEREAGMTHDRVMKGVRSRAAAGHPHGRYTYGYRRIYDAETGLYVTQVADETTAPIVQELFRAVAEHGTGLCSLATIMNKRDVPTPRGSTAWRTASIRRILTNKGYLGHRLLNGDVTVENAWESLVDQATFDIVGANIAAEPTTTRPDTTVKYLLSGIARCGICGTGVVSENTKYATYHCNGRYCVSRSRKNLDAYITEIVLSINERDSKIGNRGPDPRLGEALKTLAAAQAQLQSFEDQAVAGDITAASFARIEKRLAQKIAVAEEQLKALRARAGMPDLRGRPIREVWFAAEDHGGLSLPEKRQIIRNTVAIRIMPTRPGRREFNPADVEVSELGK